MDPKVKKWLNRGGYIAVSIGALAIWLGGGDPSGAYEVAGTVIGLVGIGLGVVRELLG